MGVLSTLHSWFRPALVALFYRNIPWDLRWRLLILQPITLLTYAIGSAPYLWRRPFTVEHLPIAPKRTLRALVYKAPVAESKESKLRPLHVEIHGGGFIGGLPESNGYFDERVARETGAVVVCLSYRYTPEHPFPAAIDDIDASLRFIRDNAASRWGANPELMTIGGFSAGGNLALAALQQPELYKSVTHAPKAVVLFYPHLDNHIPPGDKPRPPGVPEKDPTRMLMPLFDSYGKRARAEGGHMDDPRLSPVLAPRDTLPGRVLMCVAGVDILYAEQMEFAGRVNEEDKRAGDQGRVEVYVEREMFHGYQEGKSLLKEYAVLCRFRLTEIQYRMQLYLKKSRTKL